MRRAELRNNDQLSPTHNKELCFSMRVLTADSASCFFLAMSVAELFLCSSSSLRGTETDNNHPLGFTLEASVMTV